MGLSILGYVLEPPRVGSANSPYTSSPNTVIQYPGAFAAAYPSGSEPNPRVDYFAFTMSDGALADATFGWSKNEVVQRFGYDGKNQRFKLLVGSAPTLVGIVGPTLNTARLKVTPPLQLLAAAPFRLSVGPLTMTVALVQSFGSPPGGTVELLQTTGELNWNASDLVSFAGQSILWQRQQFFTDRESTGNIGIIGTDLLLTPLPGTGQQPLLRIGYGTWLLTLEVASDGSLSPDPAPGTVKWSRTTGRLRFNASDIAANAGLAIYYDGVLFARDLLLPRQALGTVASPTVISGLPSAGGDLIFRVPGHQFPGFVRLNTFVSPGDAGIVQVGPTGAVQFSTYDQGLYGSAALQVVLGDLPLERGVALRLFRSIVNPGATSPTPKDTSALYPVTGAVLADPIIASPTVYLPAIPMGAPAYPVVVHVEQGTGQFTGTLPALDVPSPPAGLGYTLDRDNQALQYAERKANALVSLQSAGSGVALPDPLVLGTNYLFEAETYPGSNTYAPLTPGLDVLVDPTPGVLTFVATAGTLIGSGTAAEFNATIFTDSYSYVSAQVGDLLVVTDGISKGVYRVTSAGVLSSGVAVDSAGGFATGLTYELRRGEEVVADRYWQTVTLVDPDTKVERIRGLGVISNSPRLSISMVGWYTTRFRFGLTAYSTTTTIVATDADFGAPPAGTVEVSQATGHLNFSASDLATYSGQTVFWVRQLLQGRDYRLQPSLGFIDFTERFTSGEEGLVTYVPIYADGTVGAVIQEPLTFLVRKEVTLPYPRPAITSVVNFNPLGKRVATTIPPAVFRGGRPQTIPTQCVVNSATSTITFQPDTGYMSDALPHGANLGISERVYVDYYVFEAFGGEKSVNLANAMSVATVSITDGAPTFEVKGDQTSVFPAGYLFRIEQEQVYSIDSSVYDLPSNTTLVILAGGATFGDSFTNPKLFVSSGPVRTTAVTYFPSYFKFETHPFEVVPRGMNVLRVHDDQTADYRVGTVVSFSNGATGFDLYLVSGSVFQDGLTVVTLASNARRQYGLGSNFLKYSLRPLLEDGVTTAQTIRTPVLTQPSGFYRKIEGQRGQLLTSPTDYTVDGSGRVTYATPLVVAEELGAFYTGDRTLLAGTRIRATYTHSIAPNATNGLEGQVLRMDYTTFGPDTFYFRVETLTNFSAEVMAYFEAQALSSVPSGGPITSNASSPKLYDQGQESVYFPEGHIANQDYVAQRYLKYLNDGVNHLEDALQSLDGRIVGAWQGRFRFDGVTTNPARTSYSAVTNEIDDVFQVSKFPYTFTWPPLSITYLGTYQALYVPGNQSRLYPTARTSLFGVTTGGQDTGAITGNPILDLRWKNLASVPPVIYRRLPRGQVIGRAEAGDTLIHLDNTGGSQDFYRPAFTTGMKVVVVAQDGSILVGDGTPLTVGVVAPGSIQVSALPVAVPVGSTVYLCVTGATPDTTYAKNYRTNTDLAVDMGAGALLYVTPYPPLDGSVGGVPAELRIHPPDSGEFLQVDGTVVGNTSKAPFRFPALDGLAMDDCGDTGLPMKTLSFENEQYYDVHEVAYLTAILATTPAVAISGVSLDVPRTTLTCTVPWTGPVPQVWDLVRFTTGPNATAGFRRITGVGASTLTVDVAFPTLTASDSVVITAGADVAVGAATFPVPMTLDDPTLSASILAGMTVIITSGANVGVRRQVVARLSGTQLQLDHSVPFPLSGGTYRVSNHLSTCSLLNYVTPLVAGSIRTASTNDRHLGAEADSQVNAITRFFDGDPIAGTAGNLTDIVPSQVGTANGTALLGTTNFVTAGVTNAHYVYIRSGSDRGFYRVTTVNTPTQLTVATGFPVTEAVTYRIVKPYNMTTEGLQALFAALVAADDWASASAAWASLVATTQPVYVPPGVVDANVYANSLLTVDVTTRVPLVGARSTFVNDYAAGPIPMVGQTLGGRDKFYDVRFTWIDGRVNIEKGLLYLKTRAITTRDENLAKQLNDLTRMLSMEAV